MRDEFDLNDPRQPDPWEQGTYQTGSTKPPKSHGGLVAVLLAVVILLGGIASAMGILNIKLFRQLQQGQSGGGETVVAFSNTVETATTAPTATDATEKPAAPSGDVSMVIQQTPAAIDNIPQEGGLSLQAIYTKAIDSVVSISCATGGGSASGTGVVLSADGYVVTNRHVVEDALSITVQLTDGRKFSASLVGADTISDLAVLYIPADGLTPAEFGDSSTLQVGDSVVAIGDPLGVELRGTMTDGIISAINRDIVTQGRTMTLIQTNAALNAGNSGGPLLNCYGQVIGINTMKIGDYMNDAGVEGLGFAIPSTTVKEIVDQLVAQGYVSGRPELGITGESIPTLYQIYHQFPQGLYITQVDAGSPAEVAGIQPGDILLSMDGVRITDMDGYLAQLYTYEVGDVAQVVLYRRADRLGEANGQYALELTVGESTG